MASFTFIASKCLAFDAFTLNQAPLGGTETAVIRLADALAERGHEVTVYTTHSSPQSNRVRYVAINDFKEGFATDVLISARDWYPALVGVRTNRRYFWTGDAYDQPASFGAGDRRVSNAITGLICVSAWHASTFSAHSGFPIEKTFVLRNGIHLPYFQQSHHKARKNLIYSSTPYRGLAYVPKLFRAVRQKHPDAVLNIFSGYEVYQGGEFQDHQAFETMVNELKNEPGIVLHGNVKQDELARHFLESSVLFYPNTFAETSCITALEAQAAGCVVLSSQLGALPETVGDAGILIPGHPKSEVYQNQFVAAADTLLADDQLWESLSKKASERVQREHAWPAIAAQCEALTLGKNNATST